MLTHKQEMFELWWESYKSPHPEDVRTQNFQSAFEAGYKAAMERLLSVMEDADSWGGRR